MMFECLTSLFAANPLLSPVFQGKPNAQAHHQNSVVAAIDIATFTDVDEYRSHLDDLITRIKALPPAVGFTEVLVPGEPEHRVHAGRENLGIPLRPGTVQKLSVASERFGIPVPW
jgi:LDH2 family malate/lactate/ureidoglycolate dehydrogenase